MLDEIRHLLGSHDEPAHERLRQLALLKLPELDEEWQKYIQVNADYYKR